MLKLKISKIGNSAGLLLPREALAKLRVEQGDSESGGTCCANSRGESGLAVGRRSGRPRHS